MISRLFRRLSRGRAASPPVTPATKRADSAPAATPAPPAPPSKPVLRVPPAKPAKPVDPHFAIEDYVELLRELLARGVRFDTLEAPEPTQARAEKPHFIKHDIHHDLENTLRVAEAEHDIGVCSTYFMMHENPINRKYFRAPATWVGLRRIQEMGHLIGLHVDGFLLIEQYGDLARGIDQVRKVFAGKGIVFKVGNTHGNSGYQKKYDFEPMNFYKEVRRPTNCTEKLFMDHYGKYSFHDLGFEVWADTSIWTSGGGEWLVDYFVSDNATNIAAGAMNQSTWTINGAKWDLSEKVRRGVADYVAQGSCVYLIHPQFYRPRDLSTPLPA
jgi:hypothetical protein